MSLRPAQNFALIVAALVVALLGESALLWQLSHRPAAAPINQVAATQAPTPAAQLFTVPGLPTTPETINRKDPRSGTLPLPKAATPSKALAPDQRALAKNYFDAGNAALANKDQKTALENFQRVVQIAPDHLPTRLNLALLYLGQGRPDLAIEHLKRASDLAPQNAAVRFNLARAYLSLKRPQDAIAPLRQVVALAPKERPARALLASVYIAQKRPLDAYAQWKALAQADSHDVEAQMQCAGLADALKRPQETEKWLRSAQAGSPRDPRPALLLGRLFLSRNKPQAAAKVLSAASQARPDVFEIFPMLANARLAAGDLGGARDALQSALLRLPPAKTPAETLQRNAIEGGLRLSLGRVWGQSKKPAQARHEFERAAQLLPRDPTPLSLLATAATQSGDRRTAISALQKSLKLDAKRFEDRRFLAHLLAQNKDWDAASAQYALYTQAQPRDFIGLIEWAQVAHNAKNTALELDIWNKWAIRDPKNPYPYTQRGTLLRDLKRPDEALQDYQKALRLKSDDPNALYEIAQLQNQLKRPRDAAQSWRRVLELRPDFVPAYASFLESSDQSGGATAARLFLAKQLATQKENPRVLSGILHFYEQKKQDSQAQALLTDIVQRNPKAKSAKAALDSFQNLTPTSSPVSKPTLPPTTAPTVAP